MQKTKKAEAVLHIDGSFCVNAAQTRCRVLVGTCNIYTDRLICLNFEQAVASHIHELYGMVVFVMCFGSTS